MPASSAARRRPACPCRPVAERLRAGAPCPALRNINSDDGTRTYCVRFFVWRPAGLRGAAGRTTACASAASSTSTTTTAASAGAASRATACGTATTLLLHDHNYRVRRLLHDARDVRRRPRLPLGGPDEPERRLAFCRLCGLVAFCCSLFTEFGRCAPHRLALVHCSWRLARRRSRRTSPLFRRRADLVRRPESAGGRRVLQRQRRSAAECARRVGGRRESAATRRVEARTGTATR